MNLVEGGCAGCTRHAISPADPVAASARPSNGGNQRGRTSSGPGASPSTRPTRPFGLPDGPARLRPRPIGSGLRHRSLRSPARDTAVDRGPRTVAAVEPTAEQRNRLRPEQFTVTNHGADRGLGLRPDRGVDRVRECRHDRLHPGRRRDVRGPRPTRPRTGHPRRQRRQTSVGFRVLHRDRRGGRHDRSGHARRPRPAVGPTASPIRGRSRRSPSSAPSSA